MYKGASENLQSRAQRITMKDMPAGTTITLNDEYENGKKALNHIDRMLNGNLTDKERKELGAKKLALASRQCEIKKQIGKFKPKHNPKDYSRSITKAMHELIPQDLAQKILARAKVIHEEDTQKWKDCFK